MCRNIVFDLIDLVVETMVEEERGYERLRSTAIIERSEISDEQKVNGEEADRQNSQNDGSSRVSDRNASE